MVSSGLNKRLLKLHLAIIRREATLMFLQDCREFDILPRTFQINHRVPGIDLRSILKQAGKRILSRAIRNARRSVFLAKDKLQKWIDNLTEPVDTTSLQVVSTKIEKELMLLNKKYDMKLSRLIGGPSQLNRQNNSSGFVNRSTIIFTTKQLMLLQKGPDYVLPSQSVKRKDLALDLYNLQQSVDYESRPALGQRLASLLTLLPETAKPIEVTNIDRICKSLRMQKQITYCKADKTNHIVAMDTRDYKAQLNDFITTTNCEELREDPTLKFERKILKLLRHKDAPDFLKGKEVRPPCHTFAPILFGVNKTHKPGNIIWPMVTRKSHPLRNVELALLKRYVHFLIEHTYRANSTKDIVDRLNGIQLHESKHAFYKYDIQSMYPTTNVEHAIGLFRQRILEMKDLTPQEMAIVTELIRMVVETSYFRHDNKYYKQTSGVPIGGSLSGLLSEMVMQDLETKYINPTYNCSLVLYMRFVDDILIIWKKTTKVTDLPRLPLPSDLVDEFQKIRPEFVLNCEDEEKSTISYLDLAITLRGNNVGFKIYRKPTYNWHLPSWKSLALHTHKKAAVLPLLIRAYRLLGTDDNIKEELNIVLTQAIQHGYPLNILKKWRAQAQSIARRPAEEFPIKPVYRRVHSSSLNAKIREEMKPFGIRVVHKKVNTLLSKITNAKSKNDKLNTPGVYQIHLYRTNDGEEEHAYYIGRTMKGITERIKQHRDNVSKRVNATSLATAVIHEGWTVAWEDTRVIKKVNTYWRGVLAEHLEINLHKNSLVNVREISPVLDSWTNAVKSTAGSICAHTANLVCPIQITEDEN